MLDILCSARVDGKITISFSNFFCSYWIGPIPVIWRPLFSTVYFVLITEVPFFFPVLHIPQTHDHEALASRHCLPYLVSQLLLPAPWLLFSSPRFWFCFVSPFIASWLFFRTVNSFLASLFCCYFWFRFRTATSNKCNRNKHRSFGNVMLSEFQPRSLKSNWKRATSFSAILYISRYKRTCISLCVMLLKHSSTWYVFFTLPPSSGTLQLETKFHTKFNLPPFGKPFPKCALKTG